jgi:diacylglycerol kinase family enzyme
LKINQKIACGGDGTLFEVVQGVMSRSDWKEFHKKIILGHLPAGTGNAMATELGAYTIEDAAFIIARGSYAPLDIISIFQKNHRYYSFLSLTFGMVADIDLGSDKFRHLHTIKNEISAIKSIIQNKAYKVEIKYVEADPENEFNGSEYLWNAFSEEPKSTFQDVNEKYEILNESGPSCPYLEKLFQKDLKNLIKVIDKNDVNNENEIINEEKKLNKEKNVKVDENDENELKINEEKNVKVDENEENEKNKIDKNEKEFEKNENFKEKEIENNENLNVKEETEEIENNENFNVEEKELLEENKILKFKQKFKEIDPNTEIKTINDSFILANFHNIKYISRGKKYK